MAHDKHKNISTATADGAQPKLLRSGLRGAMLVCGDCEDRGSGPTKLNASDVAKRLKQALRPAKGRVRVAVTKCLGPCPKKAMTCALVAGPRSGLYALARRSEVSALAQTALVAVESMDGAASAPVAAERHGGDVPALVDSQGVPLREDGEASAGAAPEPMQTIVTH